MYSMGLFVLVMNCEHGWDDVPKAVVCTGCDAIGWRNFKSNTYVSVACVPCDQCPKTSDDDKTCECTETWRGLLQGGTAAAIVGAVFGLHTLLGFNIGFRLQPLLFSIAALFVAAAAQQAPGMVGGVLAMDADVIAASVQESDQAQTLLAIAAAFAIAGAVLIGRLTIGEKVRVSV